MVLPDVTSLCYQVSLYFIIHSCHNVFLIHLNRYLKIAVFMKKRRWMRCFEYRWLIRNPIKDIIHITTFLLCWNFSLKILRKPWMHDEWMTYLNDDEQVLHLLSILRLVNKTYPPVHNTHTVSEYVVGPCNAPCESNADRSPHFPVR